jgi:anti-anti-sigma factor
MQFAYSVDSTSTETRIRARGEIDMAVADRFAEAITAALTNGSPRVIVDLTDVTFMDSSGISALLRANKVAAEHRRSLTVENPAPMVHRVLEICGVLDLLSENT